MSIQTAVYDTFTDLYPGQFADMGSATLTKENRAYKNETPVSPGEAAVKGVVNPANDRSVLTPFKVKRPIAASVDADFVGIVVRSENFEVNQVTGQLERRANSLVTVTERGSGAVIAVVANAAVSDGDNVYMSINAAAAPNLPVGQFTNAAAAGVVLLTGSKWYGAAASGTIGKIKL